MNQLFVFPDRNIHKIVSDPPETNTPCKRDASPHYIFTYSAYLTMMSGLFQLGYFIFEMKYKR